MHHYGPCDHPLQAIMTTMTNEPTTLRIETSNSITTTRATRIAYDKYGTIVSNENYILKLPWQNSGCHISKCVFSRQFLYMRGLQSNITAMTRAHTLTPHERNNNCSYECMRQVRK